jgi:hypothetical protein
VLPKELAAVLNENDLSFTPQNPESDVGFIFEVADR